MFIPYTGPSSEKRPGVRGAINAVVAANASLKRRREREENEATTNSISAASRDEGGGGTLRWLHDRPHVIVRPPQSQVPGDEQEEEEVKRNDTAAGNAEETTLPLEAFYADSYLWDGSFKWYLGEGVTYPTPTQPYYPALLFQRQNLFHTVAHQYPRTFAHNIYNSWTQEVLADPCLFHATLFATSSLMDVMQRRQNNPVTLRHKGETIRLIGDAVANADTHGLRHEIIAVTTYLVYFSKLLGNFEEAQKHDIGITAMLQFKGAAPLAQDTYTSYLLRLRDVWNSVVAHAESLFPLIAGPRPSSGHYTSLLALAIQKQLDRPPDITLPVPIADFLITFNNQCINSVEPAWPGYIPPIPTIPEETTTTDPQTLQAMQCVSIAATLYWTAVARDIHHGHTYTYNKTSNDGLIQALQTAILQSDTLFWLRFGPEVLRWILMTGAIAAASLPDQAWFVLRSYMITSIIEPGEMDAFLVGTDHLLWVFNHRTEGFVVEP
ncbi:hypothetical protein HK57_00596 [Aspergillus ustus]|uniref:Uncharacterized protein n=1 Tax=Aspergillus ustus TaxID=40382 RepID=A0A0C1E6E7_ASPUT|nr:hypothetical protein HK57_00596 [Aspergillus ustus]